MTTPQLFALLTLVTLSATAARIVGVERVYEPSLFKSDVAGGYRADDPDPSPRVWPRQRPEPTPMFSSNDRSRWATARMLVERGEWHVGERLPSADAPGYRDVGILFRDDYASVDRVLIDNKFYSSKPPLFTLMVAGEYWLLYHGLGWDLDKDRWPVVVTVLLTFNLLPLWGFLLLAGRLVQRSGVGEWAQLVAYASACVGTFLLTFANSLNNHSPGTCLTLAAIYPLLTAGVTRRGALLSGLAAGLLLTFELPGLALTAGLAWAAWALGGRLLGPYLAGAAGALLLFLLTLPLPTGEWVPTYAKFGGPAYEYPGSHWLKGRDPAARGIDFARESKPVYAFHLLFGHHGVWSLSPVWLLGAIGCVGGLRRWWRDRATAAASDRLMAVAVGVGVVVIAFYVARSNNYGGWTSGPRWLFWLVPLWLLGLPSALERLSKSRGGRALALAALAATVFSVHYSLANPWRHPWPYQLLEYLGWLRY